MTTLFAAAPYQPTLLLDLTAEEIPATRAARLRAACRRALRRCDTMALRVALPPLAVWAVLYSLVEYLM